MARKNRIKVTVDFQKNLKRLVKVSEVTFRTISDSTKITTRNLYRIVNGEIRSINKNDLDALADFFHKSPHDLLHTKIKLEESLEEHKEAVKAELIRTYNYDLALKEAGTIIDPKFIQELEVYKRFDQGLSRNYIKKICNEPIILARKIFKNKMAELGPNPTDLQPIKEYQDAVVGFLNIFISVTGASMSNADLVEALKAQEEARRQTSQENIDRVMGLLEEELNNTDKSAVVTTIEIKGEQAE